MIKNIRELAVETGDFAGEIRPSIYRLETSKQLFDVYRMAYECYLPHERYFPNPEGLWITHPEFDHSPETTIFLAQFEGETVGSISMTLDGTRGLPLDRDYFRTCMLIRAQRLRLAQVWRLLVKKSCPLRESIVTSLLAETISHLLTQKVQTGLFLVQDEHAFLCRELLNAITLLRAKCAPGLSNASSILMRGELENLKCLRVPRKEALHAGPACLSR